MELRLIMLRMSCLSIPVQVVIRMPMELSSTMFVDELFDFVYKVDNTATSTVLLKNQ